MRRVAAIARRELVAYFHAPIAYVVMVAFLALEGFSFWAVVQVLSDPARPSGYGAVLRTHFGGTFLYWVVLFAVAALLTMRLVAEERRSGTWEALLTTPAGEGEVVLGKWLGALAFYLLLWIPTLVYPVLLAIYAPSGTEIDPGPIAAAYLGVVLSGAGFLALGLAASAATDSQVVAAVGAFGGLLALLLIGQLSDLGQLGPAAAALVHHLDLRGHMDDMARGAIDADAIAVWTGLTAISLAVAVVLCARGRGAPAAARRRAAAAVLVATGAVLANALAARHPLRWDVTRAGVNRLDERTRAALAVVDRPLEVTVVRPDVEEFEAVYAEVDRLLAEMGRAQPLLVRRTLDPSREPQRLAALADELALAPRDLADAGAVLLELGGRRVGVDLLDLASFGKDALDQGAMTRFRAEEALARAVATIAAPMRARVCATDRNGEMPLAAEPGRAHWGAVADRLRRDGFTVEAAGDLRAGVPPTCRVLVVAAPEVPLAPDAALAVDRYLAGGGRVLVAASDRPIEQGGATSLPATGLELVLGAYGVSLPPAVVVDPGSELDLPLAWATADGYGEHPITRAFRGRRFTVWQHPRPVLYGEEPAGERAGADSGAPGASATGAPSRRGAVLVHGSPSAWGETDLDALFGGRDVAAGPGDLIGASSIAVAVEGPAGARLVVLGSGTSPSSEVAGRGLGAADALVASAVAWLAGSQVALAIADKTPEHVRLLMTAGDRRAVFALCVIALPLLAAGLGGLFWWRRRRG